MKNFYFPLYAFLYFLSFFYNEHLYHVNVNESVTIQLTIHTTIEVLIYGLKQIR